MHVGVCECVCVYRRYVGGVVCVGVCRYSLHAGMGVGIHGCASASGSVRVWLVCQCGPSCGRRSASLARAEGFREVTRETQGGEQRAEGRDRKITQNLETLSLQTALKFSPTMVPAPYNFPSTLSPLSSCRQGVQDASTPVSPAEV